MKNSNPSQIAPMVISNPRFIITLAVYVALFVSLALAGLNQVERKVRNQNLDALQTVLQSTQDAVNDVWLHGLFLEAEFRVSEPVVVDSTKALLASSRQQNTLIDHPAQQRLRDYFREYLKQHDAVGIFIIAPDGTSLASMRDDNVGSQNLITRHYPERLKKVFAGQQQFIPPIPSDIPLADANGQMVENYPTMFILVPVKDKQGQVLAALSLRLNPFDSFTRIAQTGRISDTGETYLFDPQGRMITESRFDDQLMHAGLLDEDGYSILKQQLRDPGVNLVAGETAVSEATHQPLTRMAQQATAGKSGSSSEAYRDYRGVPVLSVWQWDEELGIGFATEINEYEALEPYRGMLVIFIGMLLGTVLLGMGFYFVMSRFRRQATEAVAESEAYLRVVLDNAVDGIIIINEKGIIETFNKAAERIFGYAASEVIGKNQSILIPEAHRSAHPRHLKNYVNKDKSNVIVKGCAVVEGLHKDGGTLPLRLGVSINHRGGRRVFTAIIQDLTEQQQREEELHKLKRAVEQSPSSIVITNLNGVIEYVNPKFCEISGYEAQEVLGQTPGIFKSGLTPAETYKNLWATIRRGEEWKGELLNKKKNGETFWEGVSISAIRNAEGEITHYMGSREDITEKKQTEISMLRFRAALDSSTDGIYLIDRDRMKFVDANRSGWSNLGYERDELLGMGPHDLKPDHTKESLAAILDQVFDNADEGGVIETVHARKDGSRFPVEILLQSIPSEEGNLIVAVARDITSKLEAEKVLRESEQRFQRSLDFADIGVWDWNVKDGSLYWSEQIAPLFGHPKGELETSYENFINAVHPDDRNKVQAAVNTCIDKGTDYEIEHRVVWPDGTVRWLLERGDVLLDVNGQADHMLGVVQDLTERKQAEEAIRKSEERFRLFYESSPVPYQSLNEEGFFIEVNQALLDTLGYSRDEIIGMQFSDVMTPESQALVPERFSCFKKLGDARTEFDLVRKDGQQISIELQGKIATYRDGSFKQTHCVWMDETERKQAEVALRQAKEVAEDANRTKSEFLAMMSHEIRTPMNAVIGMSYLALETDLAPKQRNYVQKAHQSAESLLSIINDILDFSKIEAGQMQIESVDFNLNTVLDNISNALGLKVYEKKLELIFDIDTDIPLSLIGDPMRLTQVLVNLGNNAIKFTDQGEVVIQIKKIEENDSQLQLRFSVKDSGIGISPEQQKSLFQSFSQADSTISRKYGGTGLGLAISKRLAEMMDGEIGVDSEPGVGSTFYFTATFGHTNEDTQQKLEVSETLVQKRILIVDDNDSVRHHLNKLLVSFGFQVAITTTAREALKALQSAEDQGKPFDIVLMDWVMPEMDGVTVTRMIQEDSRLSSLPVVIMTTAYDVEELMKNAKEITLGEILIKPVTASSLLDAIHNVFGINKLYKEARHDKQNKTTGAGKKLNGAHILLVEDNPINQELALELLKQAGMLVTIANHGVEALTLLESASFDGVLMDVQMPIMDGLEASRRIREQDKFKDLPIIAMTANAMVGDREKALEAGMNDHIAKPVNPQKMLNIMAKWILPSVAKIDMPAATDKATRNEPELPDLEGIDTEAGLAICNGNNNLYHRLLNMFRENKHDFVSRFRAAQQSNDASEATRLAHTLKGVAANIGASEVQAAAAALESACNNNASAEDLETVLLDVEEALEPVMNSLQQLKENEKTDSVTTTTESDLKFLTSLFADAAQLLADNDTAVVNKVAQIRECIGGGKHWQVLSDLEKSVRGYDFEEALKFLPKLVQVLGVDLRFEQQFENSDNEVKDE